MKIKLEVQIKNMDNKVVYSDEEEKNVLTTKDVMIVCLSAPLEGDDKETGEVRINKFNIMKSLHSDKKEIELDSKEVTLLKERILKVYPSPIIYGRMCEAFGDKK